MRAREEAGVNISNRCLVPGTYDPMTLVACALAICAKHVLGKGLEHRMFLPHVGIAVVGHVNVDAHRDLREHLFHFMHGQGLYQSIARTIQATGCTGCQNRRSSQDTKAGMTTSPVEASDPLHDRTLC